MPPTARYRRSTTKQFHQPSRVLPDPSLQQNLVVQRTETQGSWTTDASVKTCLSATTATSATLTSNILGPCGTVDRIFSNAGRRLKTILEALTTPPKRDLHQKVLLMGIQDAGKSTIWKQMQLYNRRLSPLELDIFRQVIIDNVKYGMLAVLDTLEEMRLTLDKKNIYHAILIRGDDFLYSKTPLQVFHLALKSLWKDTGVQATWEMRNRRFLPENLFYFMSALDRLVDPRYRPTEEDVLRSWIQSIGITRTTFEVNNRELIMVDLAGARSERRKWIHTFEDVTSVLFVVSLSGYDQCLAENYDINQMQEAMEVWESFGRSRWFQRASISLLFNKYDIFVEKVKTSRIKDFFPDFDGEPGDAAAGVNYFTRRFVELARDSTGMEEREINVRITTATDPNMLMSHISTLEEIWLRRAKTNNSR